MHKNIYQCIQGLTCFVKKVKTGSCCLEKVDKKRDAMFRGVATLMKGVANFNLIIKKV